MAEENTVAKKQTVGAPGDTASFVTLVKTIGNPGEQGEAWLSHSTEQPELEFVVKICRTPTDSPGTSVAEFERECNVLAHMNHSNIVKIVTSGKDFRSSGKPPAYPFYVMEYLGGGVDPLSAHLASAELVPSRKLFLTLRALRDGASALEHVHHHEGRYVHGDVKASNILISGLDIWNPVIKLIDFGFAHHLVPEEQWAEPQKHSSFRRSHKGKTEQHLDIFQLCRMILTSLEKCPKPEDVAHDDKKYWPIDYAAFPVLLELLADWASDKDNSTPDTAELDDFYSALARLMPTYDLPPDVRGAIRFFSIPEIATTAQVLQAFEAIRIPPRQLVLYTERIKVLITTPQFGALRYIRQLGFTHLVYPGAQGTRFEHSLGMYDLACQVVIRMSGHEAFRKICESERDALKFVVAALLHDVGHFPFAHQLEEFSGNDFELEDEPRIKHLVEGHHYRGKKVIGELAGILSDRFGFSATDITDIQDLAFGNGDGERTEALSFLHSLLDGPIDLDKLDYIERDAHHCGVPYGSYLDLARIKETMKVLEEYGKPLLAFDARVLGSLEQFATARHELYANVYWHRAVRSATVMFKHAFYLFQQLAKEGQLEDLFYGTGSDDCLLYKMAELTESVLADSANEKAVAANARAVLALLRVVSGAKRVLYKAIIEKDRNAENADKPYGGSLYRTQREKAREIWEQLVAGEFVTSGATDLGEHNVLIDCHSDAFPPFETIRIAKGPLRTAASLGEVAPSIHQLRDNFRKQACKIRVFVNPEALAPKYQTKNGRAEVGKFLIAQCGLG